LATVLKEKRRKGVGKMATTQQVLAGIMRSKESKDKVRAKILAQQANAKWLTSRYDKLRKGYRNKYVAVLNKKIVATSDDLDKLLRDLCSYDRSEVAAISYISERRPVLVL
jgi:hypothetical protein